MSAETDSETPTPAGIAGIDPAAWYSPSDLERLGLVKRDTFSHWRWRQRREGRQIGPTHHTLGGRIAVLGADLLEWIRSSRREVA